MKGQMEVFSEEKKKYEEKLFKYIENNRKCEVEIAKL